MTITITSNYKKAIFTWNDDMSNCSVAAIGIEDDELEKLIAQKAHEGAAVQGWEPSIA